jgi:hypothetical protein
LVSANQSSITGIEAHIESTTAKLASKLFIALNRVYFRRMRREGDHNEALTIVISIISVDGGRVIVKARVFEWLCINRLLGFYPSVFLQILQLHERTTLTCPTLAVCRIESSCTKRLPQRISIIGQRPHRQPYRSLA